ncbi:MAG: hypothetical protein ACJAR0_004527 [Candidatus Azotimanducaceae bacterium]|jgi:hypothetical protein
MIIKLIPLAIIAFALGGCELLVVEVQPVSSDGSGCPPQEVDPVYVRDDGRHMRAEFVHILDNTVMCQQEQYIRVFLRAQSVGDSDVMNEFISGNFCRLADENDRVEIEYWAESKTSEGNAYITLPPQPTYQPRSYWVRMDAFTCL